MKTIHEDLCRVITDLEVICGTLDSLRKEIEVGPVLVDDYFKILLAFKGTKDIIEVLGGLKREDLRLTVQNINRPSSKGNGQDKKINELF